MLVTKSLQTNSVLQKRGVTMVKSELQQSRSCFKLDLSSTWCVLLLSWLFFGACTEGLGVNWGTQASHKLHPSTVVQMLKDNNIGKVKLFDSDRNILAALAGSGIEVMVAIPNNLLRAMTDKGQAATWVQKNVVQYIFQGGVNIK